MKKITITSAPATGDAGVAIGSGTSEAVSGFVHKVRLEYYGSPPSTTDVTINDLNDPSAEAIISRMNSYTNTTIYPRRMTTTNTNTNVTYDGIRGVYDYFVVNGPLQIAMSQTNAGCYVIAYVYIIDDIA